MQPCNYTPEYINKIKENNSNLARALTEEKRKYAQLYTEKESLDKRVLQLTKKNHDQKKYTDYLLNVLQQTHHYVKEQTTKVEKMINKKTDDFFYDRFSFVPTPNFLDNSNFNIPSPTPTTKSYEYEPNFIARRRSNILKRSVRPFSEMDKDTSLINTSIGEDKSLSTSTSSYNASSFEGIADFIEEEVDHIRDQTKRDSFYTYREASSSPAELLANYNKTIIAIQDMELTYVNNNQRIIAVDDMSLANSGRLSDKNHESYNNGPTHSKKITQIVKEKATANMMASNKSNDTTHTKNNVIHNTVEKSNPTFININKSNESSNEILTNETNSKRITQTNADKSDKKKIPVASKSNVEISSHGAIAKETFKKKLTHTIKEKFDTIATGSDENKSNNNDVLIQESNINETNSNGVIQEKKSDTNDLRSTKNTTSNVEPAIIPETHSKNRSDEKADIIYSDILNNKCTENNYKCLSKTSTIEEPSTSETITEVTQINIMSLIPSILIDRLTELSNENNNASGETDFKKQRPDNDNKTSELNNNPSDDNNITKKGSHGNANTNIRKVEKLSQSNEEITNSNKKEKSSKIEGKSGTSKQTQKLCKTSEKQSTNKKAESSKTNVIITRYKKTEEINDENNLPTTNSSRKLSFKIPKKSVRPKRAASMNVNYKESPLKIKMRRE
ncbi:probable cyclin-dependent serine/threonine-protein kinase DDB_G0292550 isoform X2 [Chrysoperla carnea]|uniref:probable cyclin-dependent serine/threonine-protein kinase DDB_G0292550 isoform X2 n=1 Tax=Chrysoperla carnea TaxID=189513 RepID=UPI001D07B5DD|nr:probable cyclin-dependent serine/threonine-protein kinase DDB_G0292550 isoform X2 [Chrysoperla carnea]